MCCISFGVSKFWHGLAMYVPESAWMELTVLKKGEYQLFTLLYYALLNTSALYFTISFILVTGERKPSEQDMAGNLLFPFTKLHTA